MSKLVNDSFKEPAFPISKAFFYAVMAILTIQIVGGIFVLPAQFYPLLNHVMMPLGFLVSFICAIAILLTTTQASKHYLKRDILQKFSITSLALAIGIWFCLLPIAEFTTTLIPTTGPLEDMYKMFEANFTMMLEYKLAGFIMVCILAPIFEEIIFRGIILKGMLNFKINPTVAIILSGFIFGIAHLNPWQFVGAGLLGTIFGFIYYRTKSLFLPMLLHALNNCLSYGLMMYYDGMEESLFDLSDLPLLIAITLVGILFCYLLIKTTKNKYI